MHLADGRTIQVSTDGGEGYFREELFKGTELSFSTHQAFIANGRSRVLPTFGKQNGGEMTTEPETDVPDDDDDEESEDDE